MIGAMVDARMLGLITWAAGMATALPYTAGSGDVFELHLRGAVGWVLLVLVPLVERRGAGVWVRYAAGFAAVYAQLGAAFCVAISAPYLLFELGRVLAELRHFRMVVALREGISLLRELYGFVGALWLLCFQAGVPLLGYEPTMVLLTAIHFHFAGWLVLGFAAKMPECWAGSGRWRRFMLYGLALTPAVIGAGIHLSSALETIGVLFFAASLFAFAHCLALSVRRDGWSGRLRGISAFTIFFSIVLALLWNLSIQFPLLWGGPLLTLRAMAYIHGSLNIWGFATPLALSENLSAHR